MRIEKSAEAARIIKSTRLGLGLSQQEVAEEIGVTRQSIARIERGDGGSSFDTYLKIFAHLGIDLKATRNRPFSPAEPIALDQEAAAAVVRSTVNRAVSNLAESSSGILPAHLAASVRESWKPTFDWEKVQRFAMNAETSEAQESSSDHG